SLVGDDGREVVAPDEPVGLLQLHRDHPSQWDAWDIEQHYRQHATDLDDVAELETFDEGDRVGVRVTRWHGASRFVQTIALAAGSPSLELRVDASWHERERLLKLRLPFAVRAEDATSETQFGHVRRSTHSNTSWDDARFETVAH